MKTSLLWHLSHLLMPLTLGAFTLGAYAEPKPVTIYQATLQESDQPVPEISTEAAAADPCRQQRHGVRRTAL